MDDFLRLELCCSSESGWPRNPFSQISSEVILHPVFSVGQVVECLDDAAVIGQIGGTAEVVAVVEEGGFVLVALDFPLNEHVVQIDAINDLWVGLDAVVEGLADAVVLVMVQLIIVVGQFGHTAVNLLHSDIAMHTAANLATDATAVLEVVLGVALLGERHERRGIQRGIYQRRVAEQRGVLLHVQSRGGEFDISLAFGGIVVPGRDAALVATLHKGLETVVLRPAESAVGMGSIGA